MTVPAANLLPGGQDAVDFCLSLATVLQSAESVGAAELLFEETVDYAKKRVQFGRTIGSFQAIKHRFADLLMELEAMRAAAHYAALALGDGLDDAAAAVATAGAYVDDTFAHICGEALQLHGGIGFTWEHDVHLFTRRAKVNQVLYGDGAWHRERLVRLIETTTDGGLTPWTCSCPPSPTTTTSTGRRCKAFIAAHKPVLAWKQRTGVRVPDSADDVELLRAYVRDLYDAGYRLDRFSTERGDPYEQRVLEQELGAAGVPYVLGNPLVAGALKHFGTDDQRATYYPRHGAGRAHLDAALQRARRRERPHLAPDRGPPGSATSTSWWARRCGARGRSGRTTATCWPAPSRWRVPAASPRSSSTCTAPASTSVRFAR